MNRKKPNCYEAFEFIKTEIGNTTESKKIITTKHSSTIYMMHNFFFLLFTILISFNTKVLAQ